MTSLAPPLARWLEHAELPDAIRALGGTALLCLQGIDLNRSNRAAHKSAAQFALPHVEKFADALKEWRLPAPSALSETPQHQSSVR